MKKLSASTRSKISRAQAGRKNSFFGKHHTAKTRQAIHAKMVGKRNPMFGKTHTRQAKRKIRAAALRRWRSS